MSDSRQTILILGGTREAAERAACLARDNPGWRIITSLAGRTREPRPVAGEVRIGGFGGVDGLADYLTSQRITRLIDATHPFAVQISANAQQASARTGITLERLERPPWHAQTGDDWTAVASLEDAAAAIPTGARVLLALGSQHLSAFVARTDVHFVIRMVDLPDTQPAFNDHTLLIGRPGTDAEQEAAILKEYGIDCIVCRNSGGRGAYAKIEAARMLRLPVIMVARPSAQP